MALEIEGSNPFAHPTTSLSSSDPDINNLIEYVGLLNVAIFVLDLRP